MKRKTGKETFSNGKKLLDYWSWAHSELLINTERGKVAEYIVAMALDIDEKTRVEWDAYDLKTECGMKIEVKSSAYLQNWNQEKLSEIRFDISPKKVWNETTNKYSDNAKRNSDIYIFCLLACKEIENVNLLDLEQWEFYVVESGELNKRVGKQKTITLNSLKKLDHIAVKFNDLKYVIKQKEGKENVRLA